MKINLDIFLISIIYEKMTDVKNAKNAKKFYCEKCGFVSSNKYNIEKHLSTDKHNRLINTDEKNAKKNFVCNCGKSYKHSQSLYNHKKKCSYIHLTACNYGKNNNKINNEESSDNYIMNHMVETDGDVDFKKLFIKIISENHEMKEIFIKQHSEIINENKELRNTINELIPKVGNNNKTINNTKNKFNINIFLNEKCREALSIDQFIENIEISLNNLLTTKDKGLTEGLTKIFIENMSKLSLYERPMHCTDKKRETMYIKTDGGNGGIPRWEKDEDNKEINQALRKVSHKQIQNIKQWTDRYPNYMTNDRLQEEYMKVALKCTSDIKEDKVLKKICDNVYLTDEDKK